jgi:hypothetical protein
MDLGDIEIAMPNIKESSLLFRLDRAAVGTLLSMRDRFNLTDGSPRQDTFVPALLIGLLIFLPQSQTCSLEQ